MLEQSCELILASTSKIRKQILQDVGLKFKTISPTFDEDAQKGKIDLEPQKLALYLASQKALSISQDYPLSYVIGSDQVCEFEGREVFKSHDLKQAFAQLKSFTGKTHYQNNAVVIAYNSTVIFENVTKSKLTMHNLTDAQIESYLNFDNPIGCAGSYKYESMGKHLFEEVTGDYYGILGLSIQPILAFLHKKQIISINS